MPRKSNDGLEKLRGMYVEVRNNNVEDALKRLKRLIKNDNLLITIQNNMYYVKPSARRRDKKNRAKARQQSENRKNQ